MKFELEKNFGDRKAKVEAIVLDIIKKHQIELSQFIIDNLTIHLTLCVLRELNGTYIPTSDSQISHLKKHEYYQVSKEIIKTLEKEFHTEIDKDQISFTTMYLANINLLDIDFDIEYDLFDDEVKDVIHETVDKIKEELDIDLKKYPEFYRGITLHFFPALERLRNDQQLTNNPLKDQIKLQHAKEFKCAKIFNDVVTNHYQLSFNDHELAYIALHFGTVLYK